MVVKRQKDLNKGLIFDIERYAVHDGPGIRTLIFLKGCPLKCIWCQNPEGQDLKKEFIYFKNKCMNCGTCKKSCPADAICITQEGVRIDLKLCTLCGKCTLSCPTSALVICGEECTTQDLLEKAEKERRFYENSNGGVTLSGGEPIFQNKFSLNLLKKLKSKGINTTIETCGYIKWSTFETILNYTDLVLYDIKMIDSKKHRKYTGVKNDIILENLINLSLKTMPYIIRIPLIPNLNDTENDLYDFITFFKKIKNQPMQIDILPYNSLCIEKYNNLNREFLLKNLRTQDKEQIRNISNKFENAGFITNIGGS